MANDESSIGVISCISQNRPSFLRRHSAVSLLPRARLSCQRLMSGFASSLVFFVVLAVSLSCFAVVFPHIGQPLGDFT